MYIGKPVVLTDSHNNRYSLVCKRYLGVLPGHLIFGDKIRYVITTGIIINDFY